jgi:hypothetical protein
LKIIKEEMKLYKGGAATGLNCTALAALYRKNIQGRGKIDVICKEIFFGEINQNI